MTVFITILSYALIILIIALTHEFGHYITARAFGVGIEEAGLGLPPRIWGKKIGGTIYSVNAIPIGAFVKLSGEEDPAAANSLAGKKKRVRILVLSAGAIMNFLLPIILLTMAFMIPHTKVVQPIIISTVQTNTPAEQAGMLAGDTILKINDRTVDNTSDIYRFVQLNLGKTITVQVQHADATIENMTLVPRWRPPEGEGAMGIIYSVDPDNTVISSVSEPIWKALPMGLKEYYDILVLTKNGIISMAIGASSIVLLGPVGAAQITGEAIQAGISPLFELAAILSFSIGFFNLFPLPALDGGRIVFVLLEWLRKGKRVQPKTEGLVHLIGFMLLIGLALVVTYQDIIRIITGGSIVP